MSSLLDIIAWLIITLIIGVGLIILTIASFPFFSYGGALIVSVMFGFSLVRLEFV